MGASMQAALACAAVPRLQHDVFRLDVPMDVPRDVEGREGREQGPQDVLDHGRLVAADVGEAAVEIRVLRNAG